MKLKRRLLIPCVDADGISISAHFGRAPFFAVIDMSEAGEVISKTVQPNTSGHVGGKGHAHENVMQLSPHVVIVHGMGPRGIRSFESQDVAVLQTSSDSVDDAMASYLKGDLTELTEGCAHAHHK